MDDTQQLREQLTDAIAHLMARARFGSGVSMSGTHNPRPSEVREARLFVREVVAPYIQVVHDLAACELNTPQHVYDRLVGRARRALKDGETQ